MTNPEAPMPEREDPLPRRILGAIRIVCILLLPGLVTVSALVPATSMGPTAFAIRQDFTITIAQIGIAYTAFFLASSVFSSLGGWAIGRWRTVDIVRCCLIGVAVLTAFMSLSTSVLHLLTFCIAIGMINGIMAPATNVLITRLVPLKFRGTAFGIKVGAAPLASTLAATGAWAAANFELSWRATYWFASGLSLFVLAGTFCLGLPRKREAKKKAPVAATPLDKRRHNSLLLLALGGLLGASGTGVLPPFLVDSLIHEGIDAGRAASVLALGSGIGVVSRVVVGAFSDRWPKPITHLNAVAIMLGISGLAMATLGLGSTETILFGAILLFFALGWSWPGLVHYAVLITHPQAPALATTYMQTGTFLGSVIGPLAFGFIADFGSFTVAWLVAAGCVVLAAGMLLVGTRRLAIDIG
jgi:predicted MFS family arabinose efflux permease